MTRFWRYLVLAVLSCSSAAFGYTPAALPTNTALQAASTITYPGGVIRDTFGNGNGAPPLFYQPSTSVCTAPDNGAQVASADGKCWIAVFPGAGADVREWGASPSIDNATILNAAVTATASLGVPLLFPGQAFPVCSATFAPPVGAIIRGTARSQSKIITQAACAGAAATNLVLLPNTPSEANGILPTNHAGMIDNMILDGNGITQYVLEALSSSRWSFPGSVVRAAKPSTVTTATTSATTASGSNTLTFSSTAAASVGALVDDLTRAGVVRPGTLVNSCTPNCTAATSVTLSDNIQAFDDGSGVANGDTIRFMTNTANVYLQGGDAMDFSENFTIENMNNATGPAFYTSQTTLPMAGLYMLNAADTNFSNILVVNAMYGVIDRSGNGNIFGPGSHVWGQIVATGQPYDLRPQYGWAVGPGEKFADFDCDDPQIACIYASQTTSSGSAGVNGKISHGTVNWNSTPPSGNYNNTFGVLLGSGITHIFIDDNEAYNLEISGPQANIVYQRGTADGSTYVYHNGAATYCRPCRTFEGAAVNVPGNATNYLGPFGASTTNVNFWTAPQQCAITGLYVATTGAPGAGNTYTYTVYNAGASTGITGTQTGASTYSAGVPTYPVNTQIPSAPPFTGSGTTISLQVVASAGAPANNYGYRIYTNCP